MLVEEHDIVKNQIPPLQENLAKKSNQFIYAEKKLQSTRQEVTGLKAKVQEYLNLLKDRDEGSLQLEERLHKTQTEIVVV
jgi:chromosome segregation ATPase